MPWLLVLLLSPILLVELLPLMDDLVVYVLKFICPFDSFIKSSGWQYSRGISLNDWVQLFQEFGDLLLHDVNQFWGISS